MEICDTMKCKNTGRDKRCKEFSMVQMKALLVELVKEDKLREACFLTLAINTPLTSSQILQLKVKNFVVPKQITGRDTDGNEWSIKIGDSIYKMVQGYISNKRYIKDSNNRDSLLFGAQNTVDSGGTPIKESAIFATINYVIKHKFYLVDNPKFGSINNTSLKSIYWKKFNKYWEKQQEQNPYIANITMGFDNDIFIK